MRPIYHQKDDNSDAHLFFGLLSYWIVNTIRHKLKLHGITHYWTELKRILSTQKAITTEVDNVLGERVELRFCSDPTDAAAELYRALGYHPIPFKDPDCGFLLFRTFNGRELTDNQILLLLQRKRTGYLKFTSKKGKKYEASLELDDNYRIDITFKDNKPKK